MKGPAALPPVHTGFGLVCHLTAGAGATCRPVSATLPRRFLAKIQVLGTDYSGPLAAIVDQAALPPRLGGDPAAPPPDGWLPELLDQRVPPPEPVSLPSVLALGPGERAEVMLVLRAGSVVEWAFRVVRPAPWAAPVVLVSCNLRCCCCGCSSSSSVSCPSPPSCCDGKKTRGWHNRLTQLPPLAD